MELQYKNTIYNINKPNCIGRVYVTNDTWRITICLMDSELAINAKLTNSLPLRIFSEHTLELKALIEEIIQEVKTELNLQDLTE